MRQATIARNYAEALLELAKRAKDLRGWGSLIQGVADSKDTTAVGFAVWRHPELLDTACPFR